MRVVDYLDYDGRLSFIEACLVSLACIRALFHLDHGGFLKHFQGMTTATEQDEVALAQDPRADGVPAGRVQVHLYLAPPEKEHLLGIQHLP